MGGGGGKREIYDREKWIKNTGKYCSVEFQVHSGDIPAVSVFDIPLLGVTRLSSEAAFAGCAFDHDAQEERHEPATVTPVPLDILAGLAGALGGADQRPAPSTPGQNTGFRQGFRIPGVTRLTYFAQTWTENRTGMLKNLVQARSCSIACLLARLRAQR